MTPVDPDELAAFRRADAAFDALLDVPRDEWPKQLALACAGDPQLQQIVSRLIAAHDALEGFLVEPAGVIALPLLFERGIDRTGDIIARYQIIRQLGRGGMASVWLARDQQLERDVAIKVVDAELRTIEDGDGASATRASTAALREAQVVARLDHPNVAGIYDVGHTDDGALWFAMPYCSRGSLSDLLRREPLSKKEMIRIARELAGALAATHALGIAHRDVKPANVLFDASGRVRLADFGIAQQSSLGTMHRAQLVGTVAYLSPEQVGEGDVDHRTDLWSLGVTLYEMLEGRRPFEGANAPEIMRAIARDDPRPLSRAPAPLKALTIRLLAKDPADRPSAADVLDELNALAHVTSPPRRSRAWLVASGAVVVALAVMLPALLPALRVRTGTASSSDARGRVAPSIVVLPFENVGRDSFVQPFVDGLTHDVTLALARVPGLMVSSRASATALHAKGMSAKAVADSLDVATVLEASVRRDSGRVRLTARLLEARSERVLWSQNYNEPMQNVFAMQQQIAAAIVMALNPQGSTEAIAAAPVASIGVGGIEVHDLLKKARYLRHRRTEEALAQAVQTFEQVIALDSTSADAWAGLANTYVMQVIFSQGRPDELVSRARSAAQHALTLDTASSEAYAALGHLLRIYDFDWSASLRATQRAMELSPGDEMARMLHAITLLDLRRFDEAERTLHEARVLNAVDNTVHHFLGRLYMHTGRLEEAASMFHSSLQLNPDFSFAHEQLGYLELLRNNTVEALRAFRRAAELTGVRDSAHLAYALAVTGQQSEARRIVRALVRSQSERYLPPVGIAAAYAGLGEKDSAFHWLERAWAERAATLDVVALYPSFVSLYSDPRWTRFLKRTGLEL